MEIFAAIAFACPATTAFIVQLQDWQL